MTKFERCAIALLATIARIQLMMLVERLGLANCKRETRLLEEAMFELRRDRENTMPSKAFPGL